MGIFSSSVRAVLMAAAIAAAPAPAWAEICEDLWFTRNLTMHRAGYCFGSTLGQRLFSNQGCVGKSITLDPATAAFVAKIQRREKELGCAVDTSQAALALRDQEIRRRLADLPLRDEYESACIGWRGAPLALRAGRSARSKVIGQVEPGDSINYSHVNVGDWSYVTAHGDNWSVLKSGGWLRDPAFDEKSCRSVAG